ncbi:MAG TPA: DUF3618 domain-containing protein [Pseudonocardia sp.]|nr:DUF3618 domain-containing protein [Pseudonocardia sp.]
MSQPSGTPATSDPEQLRRQTERIRSELAETVDALAAKADVKSRAKDKIAQTREQAQQKVNALGERAREHPATAQAGEVAAQAKEQATVAAAQAREKAAVAAAQAREQAAVAATQARKLSGQAREGARRNPVPVVVGGVAVVTGVLLALRLRRARRADRSGR